MENKEVLKQRAEELANKVNGELEEVLGELVLKVDAPYVLETLNAVKNFADTPCDFLHDLCGLDLVDHLEVVYQLTSLRGPQRLRVKAKVDREQPFIDSVTKIWQGADFLEREAYDMFGIRFKGHLNLKRIYLWDEFEGYPLRKDYQTEPVAIRNIVRSFCDGE